VHWPERGKSLLLHLSGCIDGELIDFPPLLNHTQRIQQAHRAISWCSVERDSVHRRSPQTKRTNQSLLFVNPYASTGRKSLSPKFFRILLRRLQTQLKDKFTICIPDKPTGSSKEDEQPFQTIASIVSALSERGGIRILKRGTIETYFDNIAAAAVIIGPDTSSQHVAAALNRSTITCYPPFLAFNYMYWGR